jgi:hypothetical protein
MKITADILKEWNACQDGYKVFCDLMPNGATLQTAIKVLDKAGHGFGCKTHDDWSLWLFKKCQIDDRFKKNTLSGDMNSGYRNSGYMNSGYRNSGYMNSGYRNSGNWNSGDMNSGDRNSGYWNSGDWNSGDRNSGYWNSGDRNSGYWNSGGWNSGDRNSGDMNSGDRNSGDMNSGDRNSGDRNSGDWNSGDRNSGFFNTKTPSHILVFDALCNKEDFDNWDEPDFLNFDLCVWVEESNMTEQQKIDDPNFFIRGGQLQTKDYKKAFQESYNNATDKDKAKIKNCPNFDADKFYEISGIRV